MVERPLSPRSQQLKEAAEREAAAKAAEEAERLAKEEEAGNIWTAGKWLASRGASKIIADALRLPQQHTPGEMSHFAYVKSLSRERVEELLGAANLSGAVDFVASSIETLSRQTTGNSAQLNDKFATTAKFQMTYGSLSLFYGGLESLLGPPKLYKGSLVANDDKSLFNAMEVEHVHEKDANEAFTANGKVVTTSSTEWEVVCAPTKGKDDPHPHPHPHLPLHPPPHLHPHLSPSPSPSPSAPHPSPSAQTPDTFLLTHRRQGVPRARGVPRRVRGSAQLVSHTHAARRHDECDGGAV